MLTCIGTELSRIEATDPDDDNLVFDIVGDATVLSAGPLLTVVGDGLKSAAVFLNAPLNAIVCRASQPV